MGPPSEIKSWMKILRHRLTREPRDREEVLKLIAKNLDGYAAVTDAPCAQLIPELLELYPHAMVICTVRDPEAWATSLEQLRNLATLWFLRVVLLPLPGMRHFVGFISLLQNLWQQVYGRRESTLQVYHRHIAWLKEVVPPDRLVFFNVKEGWEPLRRALGKDVTEEIPFPRINDSKAIDRVAEYYIKKGLTRWAFLAAAGGITAWFISPRL